MRNAFSQKLIEFAERDKDVVLITGDLGFNFFEKFAERFPERFINVGIAEQSMAGIAAGMALVGKKVFMYSIGNFPTLRCLEQIRNDICYHKLPVCVVVNGGGMAYGYLGMSHHGTEDISIMRSLPEMTVCAPADPMEVAAGMDYIYAKGSPAFLRMNRGGERVLHEAQPDFAKLALLPLSVDSESEVEIISTGEITSLLPFVAQELRACGISVSAYSCPLVKPLPKLQYTKNTKLIVSVEECNELGGLGGALAECLAECAEHPSLLRIGMPDVYSSVVGKQDFLRNHYGLSVSKIVDRIKSRFADLQK